MITNNGAGLDRSPDDKSAPLMHSAELTPLPEVSKPLAAPPKKFEQPVLLQQSPIWSRAILWVMMGVTTTAVIWASVAKIEEAIPATGKLEPQGAVKEIKAPVGGVVKSVYVKDGQRVKAGDRLVSLDPTAEQAQLASLVTIRTALLQENQFYRAEMSGLLNQTKTELEMQKLKLPAELMSLTKSRAALAAETQLYRAQLTGSAKGAPLSREQRERLQHSQTELSTRIAQARSEVGQLNKQLSQTEIKLASAIDSLKMNQGILKDLEHLVKAGGLSRLQFLRQQEEVRNGRSEVDQLRKEEERLSLEIAAAKSKLNNTIALDQKDLWQQISENEKNIAEIDSQLTKAIVENSNRVAEIDSQLSKTAMNLKYDEITAPSDGTVFDMKPSGTGFVANTTEPLLKIVPADSLTAKVYITNRDIGFVREGMKVDVRVDSFPYSEFGDVKGELTWIGSDALPPDEINKTYMFPAKVRMDRQAILINDREVPLQSGMSVSANIKVRQRTVMSIFTDLFTKSVESLKFVR